MTIDVSNNNPRAAYTASAGQTVFTVPFVFYASIDLTVYINDALTTDYVASGGNGATGNITLNTGATLDDVIVIVRDTPLERTTDLTATYNSAAIDDQLDRIVTMVADLDDRTSRAIQVGDSEVNPPISLPSLDARKGKVLGFNTTTGAVEAVLNAAEVGTVASLSADISTLAALDTEITALNGVSSALSNLGDKGSEITSVSANIANIQTVATDLGGSNTIGAVGGSIADVNDVADSLGEITLVSGKLTNIDTVALGISNVNTVASNIAATNAVGGDGA